MKTKTLLLTSTILLSAAAAQANVVKGDILGTTETEIRAALMSSGYMVNSVEVEGDEIEIEATLDGVFMEIEVSSADGTVAEVEQDDDDASDDEGDDEDDDDDHGEGHDDDEDDDGEDDDDNDDDDEDDD